MIALLACAAISGCDSGPGEVDTHTLNSALLQRTNGGTLSCSFTSVGPQKAISKTTVSVPFEATCTVISKYLDPGTRQIKDEFVFRYVEGTPGFFSGTPPSWKLLPR